jgi:hypothetical protein
MGNARLMILLVAVCACDPYGGFGEGEASVGPVDPAGFPPANLGAGGSRTQSGRGVFVEILAFAGGAPAGYFAYPMPPGQLGSADPLRLSEDGEPLARAPAPVAYDVAPGCSPPDGYAYDARRDEVRLDEQGNVFTALPSATYAPGAPPASSYIPAVTAIAVDPRGRPCQSVKSERALLADLAPSTSSTLRAWLVIDPGAGVYRVGASAATHAGVGTQRWGWYQQYLLAYLDGGELPTVEASVTEGEPALEKRVRRLVAQRLFHPRSIVVDAAGAVPGRAGAGYDVLEARRGEAGSSPLCAVFTYDAGRPLAPEELPRDAATILREHDTPERPLRPGNPAYVYCLQVQ